MSDAEKKGQDMRSLVERNEALLQENERLRTEVKKMRADLRRGFPITEEESKQIHDWIRKHNEEKHGADYAKKKYRYTGTIGGAFTYEFTPTSIGTIGTVICSCGEEFIFSDLM